MCVCLCLTTFSNVRLLLDLLREMTIQLTFEKLQKFSKVSSLLDLQCEIAILLTFEKVQTFSKVSSLLQSPCMCSHTHAQLYMYCVNALYECENLQTLSKAKSLLHSLLQGGEDS